MDQPEGHSFIPLDAGIDEDEELNTHDGQPALVRRPYSEVDDGTEEAMSDYVERVASVVHHIVLFR